MPATWTRENVWTASDEQKSGMDWVYATLFFRNEDEAAGFKREKSALYAEMFNRYAWAMDNRPTLAGNPPVPALAMIVVGDGSGWSELAQSPTQRVCETKVYTPTPKPALGEGKIGPRYYPDDDEFFFALPGDTTPNFKKIVGRSSDGVFGVFQKHADIPSSPGNAGGEIKGLFIRLKPQAIA